MRQYALERLERVNETTLVRIRHRDWYLDLAERALPELTRADQRIWYARLTADFDNLRLALEWNRVDPDGAEPELRLAAALGRYWDIHGPRREGQKWIESALARSASAPTPARASALLWAATFAGFDDEMARSRAMLEESVAVARQVGDSQLLTNALRHLGACLHLAGDSAGLARLEEALATSRAAGNLREVAYSLCYIGRILEDAGDLVSAERLYSEGLAAGRSSGDALPVSQLLLNLGRMAAARGEYARAAAMMKESLDRSELRRSGHGERGMALLHLASLSRSLGQDVAARARCLESLELARNCGDRLMMSAGLLVMAGLEEAVGRFVQAARLFGAEAAGRPREGGMSRVAYPSPTDPARYAEDLASARRALGNDAFAEAWAQGQAMTLEEAASMVLTDNTPVGTRT